MKKKQGKTGAEERQEFATFLSVFIVTRDLYSGICNVVVVVIIVVDHHHQLHCYWHHQKIVSSSSLSAPETSSQTSSSEHPEIRIKHNLKSESKIFETFEADFECFSDLVFRCAGGKRVHAHRFQE